MDVAWAPIWDLRFAVALDGIAALYAILAIAIGALIFLYSSRYLPRHQRRQRRRESGDARFYFWMSVFGASMVGLAMAQDLILLFVFWDVTTIASYYLIGFDHHREKARVAALMALVVTGGTAVLLLIGAVLLHAAYGTFSIPELAQRAEASPLVTIGTGLMVIAGLAKSAQVPFHYWLPRAMIAPTPVSAYLHSAAMVAAGVLLIGRVYPLVQRSELVLDGLIVVGLASMFVGGVLALTRDELKQLLACSTIAQYGFVVFLYGLGGEHGAGAAAFYVIAHAVAKSALFLTAGAVTEATGADRLSRVGGLRKALPLVAAGSAIAAAALAAFPLTIGFFKDELLFTAALERGALFACLAVLFAAITLAYSWRFWSGIFLGRVRGRADPIPSLLIAPILVLAAVALVGGVFTAPFSHLAAAAGADSFGAPTPIDAAYHLHLSPEYGMALAAYALGVAIVLSRRWWSPAALAISRVGEAMGPERLYRFTVHWTNRLSDAVHGLEIRNLRVRIASVLLPTGVLVGASMFVTTVDSPYHLGEVHVDQVPLLVAFVTVGVAALTTTVTRQHLTVSLVLSSSGFVLVLIYALYSAPSVMLVAVLIEMMLVLLFVGALTLIPEEVLRRQRRLPLLRPVRKVLVSTVAGAFAFVVIWGALSQPPAGQTVADKLLERTPAAHAGNSVTAILADFRGLDTLGEITVLAVVMLGVATLLAGGVMRSGRIRVQDGTEPVADLARQAVTRLLFLPTLVIAVAILVKGYTKVGDGFSAGVIAALGVLVWHLTHGRGTAHTLPVVRFAPIITFVGLLIALGIAAVPVLFGDPLLTHYPRPGSDTIELGTLELVTAMLFDAAIAALVFGFVVGTVSLFARTIEEEPGS